MLTPPIMHRRDRTYILELANRVFADPE